MATQEHQQRETKKENPGLHTFLNNSCCSSSNSEINLMQSLDACRFCSLPLPTYKLIIFPSQLWPNTNFTKAYLNHPTFFSRLKSTDLSYYMFENVSPTKHHSMKKIGNKHLEEWNQEVYWLNTTLPKLWWQSHATSHWVSILASS